MFLDVKESESSTCDVTTPPIQLRFEAGPKASRFCDAAVDRGFLQMLVQDWRATIDTANMTALLDLIEDEKVAPAMPMRVEVTGSYITLQVSHMTVLQNNISIEFVNNLLLVTFVLLLNRTSGIQPTSRRPPNLQLTFTSAKSLQDELKMASSTLWVGLNAYQTQHQ